MTLVTALSIALAIGTLTSPLMLAAYALGAVILAFGAWYGMGGQELAARMSRKGRHHAAFRRR